MRRIPPFRRGAPVAAMAVAVVIACSTPTEVCGCSPPIPAVIVEGTVTNASGAAVAGARVLFDGVAPEMASDPPLSDWLTTVTDAEGEFSGRAYSRGGQSGQLVLRAGVIKAGSTDTLRFRLGLANFHSGTPFDTIRVAIAIP